MNNQDDFIFRFSIGNLGQDLKDQDPLIEMIKQFIIDFQSFGAFYSNGECVHIEGFKLNSDPEILHNLK